MDTENVKPIDKMSEWERTKAIGSARYILEDVSAEEISKASGLPVGVITAAFANIFVSKDAVED